MIEQAGLVLTGVSFGLWIYLLAFRGGFWRGDQRLDDSPPDLSKWPGVAAVIPARNEAQTIGKTVASLLAQDYPGKLSVIVVDDNSDDGTAIAAGQADRLSVIEGKPLQEGWSGKLWAVHQGLGAAKESHPDAVYVLLTDADIIHDPESLRRLVAKAEEQGLDLVSLMVRLRCQGFWEKWLIPVFIFFFQKLYPFPWVNDPAHPVAAAAGGCMLVRRTALDAIGGVEAIAGRLIDDCALAVEIKKRGPIWLGLTSKVTSERAYENLSEIWRMVSRSAFEQLDHSFFALIGTIIGMAVLYLVPPLAGLALLGGESEVVALGLVTWWGLMEMAFWPTLRLYGLPLAWGVLLPVAALLFTLMTVTSAINHWRGRGGAWKGRIYSPASDANR
ncbi:MAG: glycosyltransferase [Rhodospirillales bacterium]|nr:glycosyltransferase [Rhodospirillales bacterium]